jgi:hypothetical protein
MTDDGERAIEARLDAMKEAADQFRADSMQWFRDHRQFHEALERQAVQARRYVYSSIIAGLGTLIAIAALIVTILLK